MPASLIHTRLPRALTPFSASLRTRPLCAVHRLVLLLPIALPASRHRSHGSVMPLVPPRHHSLHCMSSHDIRRTLTACPIAPTSIHVACSFSPSELVVPLLDLGLRFWPRPPSNTPPLDLALSIARTDPPLGLVRLLACRRRSNAPSSTVSSLRNLTERFLEISRRRVFIGDDAREVAPSSRDARAFLGAASPGAGAGAAVAGAGAAAAAQPKLLHFDDGQRERVAICRTRRCAS